ncbi:hypothetical protein AGIG_G12236 [Arapaima gigas]
MPLLHVSMKVETTGLGAPQMCAKEEEGGGGGRRERGLELVGSEALGKKFETEVRMMTVVMMMVMMKVMTITLSCCSALLLTRASEKLWQVDVVGDSSRDVPANKWK